jgi:hypothetical protein
MTESVEEQRARWVRKFVECPNVAIEIGPEPLRVDESADMSTEAFWADMERWFGDASDAARSTGQQPAGTGCEAQGGAGMEYGERRVVVLKVEEPSVGTIQLGKVAWRFHDHKWGYVNFISAEMRKTGEFAVAPCVVELMRAWKIEMIMYYDPKAKATYLTNIYTLCSEGHLVSYSYRPRYWHLAVEHWSKVDHKVESIWATEELLLEWGDAGEAAAIRRRGREREVQMAMF